MKTTETVIKPRYVPVCLFTYNRLSETARTLEFLQKNFLASETELFIFVDGPKIETDKVKVDSVFNFVSGVSGFKNIKIHKSDINKGLSKSIIEGVSFVLEKFDQVIVLEDDLISSANFLIFMNQALRFYEVDNRIFSISGYTMPLDFSRDYANDHYFSVRASSWGWATWKDRWQQIDWSIGDYSEFEKSKKMQRDFNIGGSDLTGMLRNQMTGKINSWAIRWCYNQWKQKQLTVYPRISKIANIGFNSDATNTKYRICEYEANLDEGKVTNFNFSKDVALDKKIAASFSKNYSVGVRVKNKILRIVATGWLKNFFKRRLID